MSKRIRDLKSPSTRWRERITGGLARPFAYFSDEQKFWLGFAAICLITTLLIHNPFRSTQGERVYNIGEIARESMISPADISFVYE